MFSVEGCSLNEGDICPEIRTNCAVVEDTYNLYTKNEACLAAFGLFDCAFCIRYYHVLL